MTKIELNEIFKKYDDISMIQVKYPKNSLVEFKDKISTDKIIKNKNKIFHKGKKLKVEYSKNKNYWNQSEFIKVKENIELSEVDDNTDKSEINSKKDEDKYAYLNQAIKELQMKVEENKKEINDLKISMNIISEINNQTTIFSKANFNFLNNR